MTRDSFPSNPASDSKSPQFEIRDQSAADNRMVLLQPIAMRVPNRHGIYSLSKLRPPEEVSYEEFLQRYSNYAQAIRVCFDETSSPATILEQSQVVTAYGFGLDCWYIIASGCESENSQ